MATSKKTSTRAKTKTTKAKSTTKKTTAKRTSAAKSNSSKGAVKKSASAKVVNKVRTREVTVQRLRSLHIMAAGLFLLLAVAAGALMSGVGYQLTVGHIAKDTLTGDMAPAVQAIYDVEIRWLAVAALVLAAAVPVLYLTRLQNSYADYVKNTRMQPWRWIDAAVTGAIAIEVLALLTGVSDIATLKLLGGVVVIASVLGLIAERQNNAGLVKPVKSAYYAGIFAGILLAVFLGAYLLASAIYGTGVEWYVYGLYAIVVGGFALLVRNMSKLLNGASNLVVERNYIVINILVKSAFAVILIVGLLRDF